MPRFFLLLGLVSFALTPACSSASSASTVHDAEAPRDAGTIHDASRSNLDGAASSHDARASSHDGSGSNLDGLPDGAIAVPHVLAACHWPSDILPGVPDGDTAAGYVDRIFTYTTGCLPEKNRCCNYGPSGGEDGGPVGECGPDVMACAADDYVISVMNWSFGVPTPPPDGSVVYPRIPSGCKPPSEAFVAQLYSVPSSVAPPTLYCCPCD